MPMWSDGACQSAGWGGWMLFQGIFFLLLLVLVITGIVIFVRIIAKPGTHGGETAGKSSALDVLEQRYASGEIERDEYLQKKSDLSG
jgi:putative membrane protein